MKKTRVAFMLTTLYLLLGITVYLVRPGSIRFMTVFGDTLPVLGAGFAFVSTFMVASRFGRREPHRIVWVFLGAGLFLWWLGELSWWVLEVALRQEAPYPSVADAFWFAGYVPLFIGFLFNFRQLDIKVTVRALWPWLLLLGVVMVVSLIFIFLPVAFSKISPTEKFLDLLYPIEDIIILGVALLTLTGLSYGVLNRPWKVIVTGFIMTLIADLIYSYLSFADLYQTGNPVDLVWLAGYLAIGVGAIYQWEITLG